MKSDDRPPIRMLYHFLFALAFVFTDIRGATVPELAVKYAKPANSAYSIRKTLSIEIGIIMIEISKIDKNFTDLAKFA